MKKNLAQGGRQFNYAFHSGLPEKVINRAEANYCLNWLIARAFRMGLIDRERFISLWRTVQIMGEKYCDDYIRNC